jgi:ATP-dependent protease ClpP protease subunit
MRDLKRLTALAGQVRSKALKREHGGPHAKWYRIENATDKTANVYLYGEIGADFWGDGTSSSDFVNELSGVTAGKVNLHVNSPGGQVFEGIAMHTAIAEHPARFTGKVDGLAASAASFILMACDEIQMAKSSKMMIHDAATGFAMASGNAEMLREFAQEVLDTAALLDEMSDTIADLYDDKAGGGRAKWRNIMRAETWYSAAQAVDAGLADGIIGEAQTDGSPTPATATEVEDEFDMSALLAAMKGAWDA